MANIHSQAIPSIMSNGVADNTILVHYVLSLSISASIKLNAFNVAHQPLGRGHNRQSNKLEWGRPGTYNRRAPQALIYLGREGQPSFI